ncbi:uncharacterized protein [Cicer arietinum]|uniref:uncharacterized protein n=1 Tax=Cicer arietinum TaxID=3827 RepID=UPI003CC625B5
MQHLFKLIEDAKYVCWNRKREDSDVMRDIFWAHPDSVKLLNLFPIVLIMDSTYKTNKYRMPLLEIVGMTSTEKTFVVGFAYLECEREENFCWALERLKDLFVTQNKFPQVIVTDRDLALMNAVGIVFPHAVNLLCRFHIEKNVGAKCKQYVLKDRQESILNMWKDIMYCSNEKEYMMRLHMFEQSCVDTKVFVDYVKETWLTPHKERFVEAWTNKVMHLGNTTTNRVESAHWKLKLMLENSMGDLCKCWEAMNNMIRLQHKRIRASFQKSFYDEEHEHRNPFYQRLNTFVSTEAQRRIAEEYDKVEWVGTDKSICGCSLRRTYGLPCACELGQYKLMGEPIPLDSVHIQWRKLSMECELTQDTEDGSELDMSTEMNALWKRFRSLDVIGKRVLKSKVRELAFPSTSSICPPPEKVKTKGRVKKSKGMKPDGYDVYRDPSYFEHVNATYGEDIGSQPSQSKKRQASQSKKHPSQSSHSSKNLLLTQFPDIIQPYIDDIFDVAADGNCGFRVIALLLGFGEECWSLVRKRLDQEIVSHVTPYDRLFTGRIKEVRDSLMISDLGVQPMDKWLSIPDMSYVIATTYNIILVTFGLTFSMTFFPMRGSHSGSTNVRPIIICLEYDNWTLTP